MKKSILPLTVISLILGTTLSSDAGPSTVYVDVALGNDLPACGSAPGPSACQTIQYALDNLAVDGTVIQLAAGTYNENVVIGQRVTLAGAGSGNNPSIDSIIVSAAASTNVVKLTTGGTSAAERMVIRDLRVTGGTGGPHDGNGITILAGSYMTFDNVTSTDNEGHGIAFNSGGDQVVDYIVSNCDLSSNPGGSGFRVASSVSVDGLSITDSTMDNNKDIGLNMIGPVTNLYVSDSAFTGNGLVGIYGAKLHRDFASERTTLIDRVTANGNGRGFALRIYGGSLTISNSTLSGNNNDVDPGNVGQGLDLSVREADTNILLSGVTAEDNEDVNIFLETKSDGSISNASLYRVTVTGSNDEPTEAFCDGCGIWLHSLGTAELSNVSIRRGTVTGNNRGIVLEAETMPVTGVTITDSDIQPDVSTIGIAVSDGAAAGNQAFCNNIIGSGVGVDNQDLDDTFDTVGNYWGEATGPFHSGTNPSGLGTEVGANVAYGPWQIILCDIFVDGFESGDTLGWSTTTP